MATPELVGSGERPSALRSPGVASGCCSPTLYSESPGRAACTYRTDLPARGVGQRVRLGPARLGEKTPEDDKDLTDPEDDRPPDEDEADGEEEAEEEADTEET